MFSRSARRRTDHVVVKGFPLSSSRLQAAATSVQARSPSTRVTAALRQVVTQLLPCPWSITFGHRLREIISMQHRMLSRGSLPVQGVTLQAIEPASPRETSAVSQDNAFQSQSCYDFRKHEKSNNLLSSVLLCVFAA